MFNGRLVKSNLDRYAERKCWREGSELFLEFQGNRLKKTFDDETEITYAWANYAYGPLKLSQLYEEGFVDD